MLITVDEPIENQFPEGKIVLMDGRVLACHPLANEVEVEVADDSMKLDTTGQYLAVGKKSKLPNQTDEEEKWLEKLFLDNAFYLLGHRERILSDSRMFLTPVAVQSGLAYTGTGGFKNPTVGVYLEWWMTCDGVMRTSKDGERSLIYRLAGSPLSGMNSCREVLENGLSRRVKLMSFRSCWHSFIKVNMRYTAAKHQYQCYSLQQLLDILHSEDNGDSDFSQVVYTMFMQHEIDSLKKRVEQLNRDSKMWHGKYIETLMKLYDKKICKFYKEYKIIESNSQTEIDDLREQKRSLKARLKGGEIDNQTYQRTLMPLNKRIKELALELFQFKFTRVNEVFPDEYISFDMIEQHINNIKKKEI